MLIHWDHKDTRYNDLADKTSWMRLKGLTLSMIINSGGDWDIWESHQQTAQKQKESEIKWQKSDISDSKCQCINLFFWFVEFYNIKDKK